MGNLDVLLRQGSKALGRPLSEQTASNFEEYCRMLLEANSHMNLTAVTEPEEVYRRHFLDSLSLCQVADLDGKRVIDVGTGAGIPGLPVKLAWEKSDVTLLDSQQKRISFLEDVCRALALEKVTCLHGRAEELGQDPAHREQYDIVLSRAVARLDLLAELCVPLTKPGGLFLAMKAEDSGRELAEAVPAIAALGGRIQREAAYRVPGTDAVRKIIVIEKVARTPDQYPRRFAKMQKSPIR